MWFVLNKKRNDNWRGNRIQIEVEGEVKINLIVQGVSRYLTQEIYDG